MFSHLTSQLNSELETVRKVLAINEALRDVLITHHDALTALPTDPPAGVGDIARAAHAVSRLVPGAPDKLDWQVYDHCAALTRLYAVYERFVGDLVAEYVRLLPKLYGKYSDLPPSITIQHRLGVGHILLRMGKKGLYKKLEEQVVVRELATGLSGASEYTLLADAFFIDRQNLRFDVLVRLFSALGFSGCSQYISKHASVTEFIRLRRADSSSAKKELDDFIGYRNEAAHKKVENVLSVVAIGTIGLFIIAIGQALANMVEQGVVQRRMDLGCYLTVLTVSEVHYKGLVVIGTPQDGVNLATGDELIIFADNVCQRATLESLQLSGREVTSMTGDGFTEVGLRLNKRSPTGAELRRLKIPVEAPTATQLVLEDALPVMADIADTDLADGSGQDADERSDADDHPEPPPLGE